MQYDRPGKRFEKILYSKCTHRTHSLRGYGNAGIWFRPLQTGKPGSLQGQNRSIGRGASSSSSSSICLSFSNACNSAILPLKIATSVFGASVQKFADSFCIPDRFSCIPERVRLFCVHFLQFCFQDFSFLRIPDEKNSKQRRKAALR